MSAVLSREDVGLEIPGFIAEESGARRVRALTEYFVRFLGLRLESLSLTSRLRVAGSTVTLPVEYSEGLKRAAELRLKTLDVLHLAYAGLLNSLRVRIGNFVTADSDILARSRIIAEQFGFNALHPKDAQR